jgi:hypothetical protein
MTTTQTTETTKIPNPLYAAAGAGDLAIENLRKLPGKVADFQERVQAELPGRITVLQDKLTQKVAEIPSFVAELRQRVVDADTDKLRESARRNANLVLTNAQEKAVAIYATLVARGEEVVGRSMPATRTANPVIAEIIATDRVAAAKTTEIVDAVVTETPTAKPAVAKPAAAPKHPVRGRKTS